MNWAGGAYRTAELIDRDRVGDRSRPTVREALLDVARHQWRLRYRDRAVKEILPETPPSVVGHGIITDTALYLTARRADDGTLFRVFINTDDFRRLLKRAMENPETASIVRETAG